MKSMDDMFHHLLQDVYYAEKQLLKALPKLAKKSSNSKLEKAFTNHHAETEGHVERLEKIFEIIGKAPRAKKCDAILGIVAEGDEVMHDTSDHMVRDAGILAAAQAAEHYEIARYGTLRAWAQVLGHMDAARLLEQTLQEERKADQLLTSIADGGVNQAAQHQQAA